MRRMVLAVALILGGIAPSLAEEVGYEFRVDGMTCPFCAATSESALRNIDGVSSANADLDAGLISVCASRDVVFTDEQLTELFLDRGFTYRSMAEVSTGEETCRGNDS